FEKAFYFKGSTFYMKAASSFFLFSLFAVQVVAHAQPAGWQSTVNRIEVRQQQQAMLRRLNTPYGYNYKSDYLVNIKYEFVVLLRDSNQVKLKSKIYSDTVRHLNYVVFEDKSISKSDSNRKRNILPSETLSISRADRMTGANIIGFPTDSCWLFKVVSGKINIYSFLSETSITSD
ncbi:MAG: hypothetical protein ACJ75F_06750, partial [Flavisolibacter sp.]